MARVDFWQSLSAVPGLDSLRSAAPLAHREVGQTERADRAIVVGIILAFLIAPSTSSWGFFEARVVVVGPIQIRCRQWPRILPRIDPDIIRRLTLSDPAQVTRKA